VQDRKAISPMASCGLVFDDGSLIVGESPTHVAMFRPKHDVADPVVSIVVPALNESLTIEDFVTWCKEGLSAAGVQGEIVIVDSSTDDTPTRARAAGARVIRCPKRGLGRAYIDAVPYIRGDFVIMGDADCTYDFRLLAPFVEQFHAGYEFVMGSRWKGEIERGSMPPHHQYFGTPFTTWILNRVYSSKFSDIHCGMRGISRDALVRMGIQSQSWEYASEMVLKSVHMELRTAEVPVRFLKDREGRVSHHRRLGWFSPFQAAWINLRAMFIYGADFFLVRPGVFTLLLGLLLMVPVSLGPVSLGSITFSLYWQFLGAMLATVGLQGVLIGAVARTFFDYTGRKTARLLHVFSYTRTVAFSGLLTMTGFAFVLPLAIRYIDEGFALAPGITWRNHLAVTGLWLVVCGFSLFVTTLLVHAASLATRWSQR